MQTTSSFHRLMELRRLGQRSESKLLEIKLNFHRQTRPPWLRQLISKINQKKRVQN
jgi:hypothetical protein